MTQIGIWTYNPWTEMPRQGVDYDCAAASTAWFGRSIGFDWTEMNVLFEMSSLWLINSTWGLLDGTGAGIVRWLAMQPCPAANGAVSWGDVNARAGTGPLIMGSSTWNHWTGVRSPDSSGNVLLANSAPGWMGVDQVLTESQFDALAPFYGVWLDV